MGAIQMQLGYKASSLELPYTFIDNFLTGCAPVYPLIYIYSLRRLIGGDPVSVQEIAEHFGLLDTDVLNAWRHFEKVGLVKVEGEASDISVTFLPVGEPMAAKKSIPQPITFLPIAEPKEKPPEPAVQIVQEAASEPVTIVKQFPLIASQSPAFETNQFRSKDRPKYCAEELAVYHEQSKEVMRLFSKAEQALGKLLDYNDMNMIFSFYDWLRLPPDVIEYLLSYCAGHDHRGLRYIETCAIDWANRGIDDLEKALTHVQGYDSNYRAILRQLGKSTFPSPAQQKLMDKWLGEMHMPMEVILDACDRTTLSAEKPSLSYVDKILAKWHKKGINTMEGIKQADEEFVQKRDEKSQSEKASPKVQKQKNNRFINFEQRENDYTKIERMAQQRLLQG